MFTVEIVQLVQLFIYVLLVIGIYKTKRYVRLFIGAILLIMLLLSPVKFKSDGFGIVESRFSTDTKVIERVVVEKESFNDKQKRELNNLKSESKEIMKNEKN